MEETKQRYSPDLSQNYTVPAQLQQLTSDISSISKLIGDIPKVLVKLRRQLRGEVLYESEDGNTHWVQMTKPRFCRVDYRTGEYIKKKVTTPWGEQKDEFIPNDEAIDEVIGMLEDMGVNEFSPLGVNSEDNYLDDLREFGCKLAALLTTKQAEWGLDKELMPMLQLRLKTTVADIRSMSLKGNTIKMIQTTTQRIEQILQGEKQKVRQNMSPYG